MSVDKPTLTYFDGAFSRGEECRLALFVAGVDFADRRLSRDQWMALKPSTPFGSVPILELPGKPVLAQSNAILGYVGRLHGLHPADAHEAALHEAMMGHVEDLRAAITPSMRANDPAEKQRLREALAATTIPTWAAQAERAIDARGPFFAGEKIHVVDFKILMTVRWLRGGSLDHIPKTVLDGAPRLLRVHDAVDAHPRVREWTSRR
jgi:glutathione S-transferase